MHNTEPNYTTLYAARDRFGQVASVAFMGMMLMFYAQRDNPKIQQENNCKPNIEAILNDELKMCGSSEKNNSRKRSDALDRKARLFV